MLHLMAFGIVVGGRFSSYGIAQPSVSAVEHHAARSAISRLRGRNTEWIYVADAGNGNLTAWSSRGKLLNTLYVEFGANAVAVNRKNWVYALGGYMEINIFKPSATIAFAKFSPPDDCYSLVDLSVGYDDTLYVTTGECGSVGGVWVFPPGNTQPSTFLEGSVFENFNFVASDRKHNVYATEVGSSSSYNGDVLEFVANGKGSRLLGLNLHNPRGLDIAANGNIVVCSAAGVQTFAPGSNQPSSTIAVPCGDISLADNDTAIYVTQGHVVTRYLYPNGKADQTLTGFNDAVSVAVRGAISD
jgi:hypothetical protein